MADFRARLAERCKQIIQSAERCATEEATKQFLVLPFLTELGYNVFNPGEVVPEHHADFSEKYKNRVDYAIFRDGTPIIAIEVKSAGAALEQDRGQLRSYFNACTTVKLGILTNGLIYECFADTDEPNIMDGTAFLSFDIRAIADYKADERTLAGIEELRRERFDPANVGTEARRKLLLGQFLAAFHRLRSEPTDDFVRLMIKETAYQGRVGARVLEEARDLVKQGFSLWVDQQILERVGLSEQAPRVKEAAAAASEAPAATQPSEPLTVLTQTEIDAFHYAQRRLAFLLEEESLFGEIAHLAFQDHQTTFRVYYKRPVAGGLFTLRENRDGSLVFTFPALDNLTVSTNIKKLSDIDKPLLESFLKRVKSDS
jgi:hypothetical protein